MCVFMNPTNMTIYVEVILINYYEINVLYIHPNSFAEHPGNISKLPSIAMSKNINWELELASNTDQMFAHRSSGPININGLPCGTVTIFH